MRALTSRKYGGRNNGRSMDMIGQILCFYRPECCYYRNDPSFFSPQPLGITVCQRHLENVITTFKRMPRFFTDDNLITTFCSFHIQLHQIIASFFTDIESQKSGIMAIHRTHIDQLLSLIGNSNKNISMCNACYCKILHGCF